MALDRAAVEDYRTLTNIIRCLVQGERLSASEILRQHADSMQRIHALLDENRLSGYFFALATHAGVGDCLSDELLQILENSYLKQASQNGRLLELLKNIKEAYESASLPFLSLKGLYIAQRFMGDFRRRFMWDVDIMVHPDDLEPAVNTAQTMGLTYKSGLADETSGQRWGIHAVDLKGEQGSLDIHFALRNLPGVHFNYEEIWASARTFSVDGVSFPRVGEAYNLVIALLGVASDIQCSHHNLRKILDIYLMLLDLDESMDWDAFFENRRREGTLKLTLNTIAFCIHYFADPADCPELFRSMKSRKKLILLESRAAAESIFQRGRQSIANRMFFSRLLPLPLAHYWGWWLYTLPRRYWHHR